MVTRKDGGALEANPLGPAERRGPARRVRVWHDPPVNLDPEPRSMPKAAFNFDAPQAAPGPDAIRPDLSGSDSPHASEALLGGIGGIESTWQASVEFPVPLTHVTINGQTIAGPTNPVVLVSVSDGELRFPVTVAEALAGGCAPFSIFSLTTDDDIPGSVSSESLGFAPEFPRSVEPSSTTIQLTEMLRPSAAERPDLFSTTVHRVSNGIASKERDSILITVPCDADSGVIFTASSTPTGPRPIRVGESGGSGFRMNVPAPKLVIGVDHPRSGAAHELRKRDLRLRGM